MQKRVLKHFVNLHKIICAGVSFDIAHYIKYARIWVFSDPNIHV